MEEKSKQHIEQLISEKEALADQHRQEVQSLNQQIDSKATKLQQVLKELQAAKEKIDRQEQEMKKMETSMKEQQFYLEKKGKTAGVDQAAILEKDKTIERLR